MSTVLEEILLIRKLSKECENKLELNSKKQHWKSLTPKELMVLLKDEVKELEKCIDDTEDTWDRKKAWGEAADVANIAAMIADNLSNNRFTAED